MYCLTLMTSTATASAFNDAVRFVCAHVKPTKTMLLDAGRAVEMHSSQDPRNQSDWRSLVHKLDSQAIDCCVHVLPPMRQKRMVFSDFDSTLIKQECIDELAKIAGVSEQVSALTKQTLNGALDFTTALRRRVALLAGLSEQTITRIKRTLVPTAGAAVVMRTLRNAGVHSVLISGGFTVFINDIAEQFGFSEYYANNLVIENGVLTGQLRPPILDAESKQSILQKTAKRLQLFPADALAIGDGANDIPMVHTAGLGIAFHGKPALVAQADCAVYHTDLRCVLYLQGISIP